MSKKKIGIIIGVILIIAAAIGFVAWQINSETTAGEISVSEAEKYLNEEFDSMANAKSTKAIAEKNSIKVNSVSYGDEKDIIIDCTVSTIDVYNAVIPEINSFLNAEATKPGTGMVKSALNFKQEFESGLAEIINEAEPSETECTVYVYDTENGLEIYARDTVINAVFGNVVKLCDEISGKDTYTVTDSDGNETEEEIKSPNVNKGLIACFEILRSEEKPDASGYFGRMWNSFKDDFYRNFIEHDRYMEILKGLWITIKLTVFALLIGIVIGFIVAFVRCTYLKNSHHSIFLRFFNSICQIYLTVIRGTPVVVQIMIIYFVIFMPIGVDKFLAAVICFGLNSGAYVAEIVRGGIMSVDNGQTEAGRSLGFGYMATMYHIVFPQAFKAVLPALANELVVLLKETSIAFYIGLGDLMYAGNSIRAATYSAFMPLVAVALIYLAMVLMLSKLVGILERRLRNNER